MMSSYQKTDLNQVKRGAKRANYDKETIVSILKEEYLCYVGYFYKGIPITIPTAYGYKDNAIYIHGSLKNRMLCSLLEMDTVSLTVSKVNGFVLARSAFHHSVNYKSVSIFGKPIKIENKQAKMDALYLVTEQFLPGRWDEVRLPNEKELNATLIIKIEIEQASAKIRTGDPADEKFDYDTDYWAGILPLKTVALPEINDRKLSDGIPVPNSVIEYQKKNQ